MLGVLLAAVGFAQEAQVSGRITDSSGGVIPDVKVTMTNTDNGSLRDTKTNSLGLYTLPLIQPGNYKISTEKRGFRPGRANRDRVAGRSTRHAGHHHAGRATDAGSR